MLISTTVSEQVMQSKTITKGVPCVMIAGEQLLWALVGGR